VKLLRHGVARVGLHAASLDQADSDLRSTSSTDLVFTATCRHENVTTLLVDTRRSLFREKERLKWMTKDGGSRDCV